MVTPELAVLVNQIDNQLFDAYVKVKPVYRYTNMCDKSDLTFKHASPKFRFRCKIKSSV